MSYKFFLIITIWVKVGKENLQQKEKYVENKSFKCFEKEALVILLAVICISCTISKQ